MYYLLWSNLSFRTCTFIAQVCIISSTLIIHCMYIYLALWIHALLRTSITGIFMMQFCIICCTSFMHCKHIYLTLWITCLAEHIHYRYIYDTVLCHLLHVNYTLPVQLSYITNNMLCWAHLLQVHLRCSFASFAAHHLCTASTFILHY